MNLPFLVRLIWLALGAFFLINLVLGLLAAMLAPALIRYGGRVRSLTASRLLLTLRLLPFLTAFLAVIVFCIPAFLWLEPVSGSEPVGTLCLVAGMAGAAAWMVSLARCARASTWSSQFVERCLEAGRMTYLAGESSPVWVVESPEMFMLLAGIFRPRVILSRSAVEALSAGQLTAALLHERAHLSSFDNLKRLLVLLAPDVLPCVRCFGNLERSWSKFAEWAADDDAVAGDSGRSLMLAAALVRVARLTPTRPAPLAANLVENGSDLSARVERLLSPAPPKKEHPIALWTAGLVTMVVTFLVLLGPGPLHFAFEALERLAH